MNMFETAFFLKLKRLNKACVLSSRLLSNAHLRFVNSAFGRLHNPKLPHTIQPLDETRATSFAFDVTLLKKWVEQQGIEPWSKHGTHMLSTCLVACWFSSTGWKETPKPKLSFYEFRLSFEANSD